MNSDKSNRFNYISLILLFILGITTGGSADLKAGGQSKYKISEIYLSDLECASSTCGRGGHPTRKDESLERNPITVNGVVYKKGIRAQAKGETVYHPQEAYDSFKSYIGVDDEIATGRDPLKALSKKCFFESKMAVVSSDWKSVEFNGNYIKPVVLATPVYDDENTVPGVVRIRNIRDNSCEVRLAVLMDDDTDVSLEVNLMILEQGVYTPSEHGISMEVTTVDVYETDYQDHYTGMRIDYQQSYINPVLLGQVITANDKNWSTFWATDITSGSAVIGKHIGEDPNRKRFTEQVAVVVIESGDHSLSCADISAGMTGEKIGGIENDRGTVVYGMPTADTIILSQSSMKDTNGGFPVLIENSVPLNGRLVLAIDEDQFEDDERQHNTEKVSWMTIKQRDVVNSISTGRNTVTMTAKVLANVLLTTLSNK